MDRTERIESGRSRTFVVDAREISV
jgi:hypothetical protein